jgi:drug/metabolite transporter (DMT)-like permease
MEGNPEKSGVRRWRPVVWVVGAVMLLVALVAKQFVGEPNWVDHLAQTGALLIGVGFAVELASRKTGKAAYRAAMGLALGSALLLAWVIGAIIARLKPEGMARAMFATVVALMLAAGIALFGPLGSPHSEPLEIVSIHGFFVALFLGSAVLFRKAAPGRLDGDTA